MPSNYPSDAKPAPVATFMGYQLWDSLDGERCMTLFLAGRMVEVMPDDEARKQALGFYDFENNPVPDPI